MGVTPSDGATVRGWLTAIDAGRRLLRVPLARWLAASSQIEELPVSARLLTTEEVASRFRTSPATVRYWRHVGIGPSGVRVGRRVLYDETVCDRWWQEKVAAQVTPSAS